MKWVLHLAALAAALAMSMPAAAKPVSRTIKLSKPVKFGKAQIEAGKYRLLIDGNKVTLLQNDIFVAEMEGRWEQREHSYRHNSYLINRRGELEEVRFGGDDRVLILINR